MNAIVFSALWGVLMMFAGVFLKNKAMARPMAIGGALIGLIVSVLELQSGNPLFAYDALHHLKTNNFNLTFIIIVYAALLLFFLLSGKRYLILPQCLVIKKIHPQKEYRNHQKIM